jgi:hypothetical protein
MQPNETFNLTQCLASWTRLTKVTHLKMFETE